MSKAVELGLEVKSLPFRLNAANVFTNQGLIKDAVLIDCAWANGFLHNSETHIVQAIDRISTIQALDDSGLKKYVGLGTAHEYGYNRGKVSELDEALPESNYGEAKLMILKYLDSGLSSLDWLWLRCFHFFGKDELNNSIFTKILSTVNAGGTNFTLTGASAEFDFSEIEVASKDILELAGNINATGLVNYGSGEALSLKAAVASFCATRGLKIDLSVIENESIGTFPSVDLLREVRRRQ